MQFTQLKNHLEDIKVKMSKMTFLQVKIDNFYDEPIEVYLREKTILVGRTCVDTFDRNGECNGTDTIFTFAVENADDAKKVIDDLARLRRDVIFWDAHPELIW